MLPGAPARAQSRAVDTEEALRAALADPGVAELQVTASLTLTGGELVVTRPVRLSGPGDDPATGVPRGRLIAGGGHRILRVAAGAGAVGISGLSFEGGRGGAPGGGALLVETGVSVVVSDCDFSGNAAEGKGAGGAILSFGSLRLERCRVTGNTAVLGGGVAAGGGQIVVSASLLHRNQAIVAGGAVHVTGAEVLVVNSTLAANSAGTAGGLMLSVSSPPRGITRGALQGVTVAHNFDRSLAGGMVVEGTGATLEIGASILAHNFIAPPALAEVPLELAVRGGGQFVSAGGNVLLHPGSAWPAPGPGDLLAVDPLLGELGFHGGRTPIYPLGAASPARDRGFPAADAALPTDQRGFPRIWPQEGRMDAGAFEFSAQLELDYAPRPLDWTAAQTPATLSARVTLPRGGPATLRWQMGAGPEVAQDVILPDTSAAQVFSLPTSFAFGATPAVVTLKAPALALTAQVTVEVVDTVPPTITLLGGNPYTVQRTFDGAYADPGATAMDARAGPVPVSTSGTVDTRVLGFNGNTITFTATDGSNLARAFRSVSVVDTVAPELKWTATRARFATVEPEPASGLRQVSFAELAAQLGLMATPDPSGPSTFVFRRAGETGGLTLPAAFPLGPTALSVAARDAVGNESPAQAVTIEVSDGMPPRVVLVGAAALSLAYGQPFIDPGVVAEDVSTPVTVTRALTAGGLPRAEVDAGTPGQYLVTYTATDAAGNTASVQRVVTVSAPVVTLTTVSPSPLRVPIDPVRRLAPLDLGTVLTVTGVPDACRDRLIFAATIQPPSGAPVHLAGLGKFDFPPGTSAVEVRAQVRNAAGGDDTVATTAFAVIAEDPNGVLLNNVAWNLALDLGPRLATFGVARAATFRQMLVLPGESRWYRFHAPAGSRIEVSLTNLPANFDLVVYGDIRQAYDELTRLIASPQELDRRLALLGAEFAPEAYSPEAYSPEAYSPEAYSPEAYSPEAYSPEAYSPEAYSPEAYSPEAYSPEAYSPEAYSPEAYSPEAYSPEAYSPEAYAAAQLRARVAFSASPGTSGEGVRFNTFSRSGAFYVRVRGQNGACSPLAPFDLTVTITGEECGGVGDHDVTPATTAAAVAARVTGSPASLLLWDRARIPGTAAEKDALAASLAALAQAANGLVVDVGGDARIQALQAQADANPFCPYAKNLVAEAIRNLVQLYRQAAPGLADLTLVGGDGVIPFFRTEDEALLASEANYFPPVRDGTHSQSSLRYAQVLTQDRYGSSRQVTLATGPYDLPEIPVGRLVETAAEVRAYLDRYRPLFDGSANSGTLPVPRSAFVAGYDFLADAAEAMRAEFATGLGVAGAVTSLISPADAAPANSWTADQLRAGFLGARRDVSYLAAHFSNARLLAADFRTRLAAREVAESPLDLAYALVLSAGCHSGYNTVDPDATSATESPDWAQALARKHALWIAGTGYQYGDTDFIEYTERLLLEVVRSLRAGAGPIPIGRALVEAKRRYLQDTPILRGIHEKTLVQVTLYGLPMVRLNLPGTRLTEPAAAPDVATVVPVAAGPGAARGLARAELDVNPLLTRVDRALDVVRSTTTVTASYYRGSDGVVSLPGEPVRPLESFHVSRPEGLVRGLGFRGGTYVDEAGFRPFTGAPATETRGVHGTFATEVFFPARPWNLNQIGELTALGGRTDLNVFPAQYVSVAPGVDTGTLRRYGQMRFTIFYSAQRSLAALANPPALNVVASEVGSAGIAFAIEAAAAAEAGVQEVWVTYTGLPGSPLYGAWQSFGLTPPAAATGIGTWTGTLPLPAGADAGLVRFMVQAANGFGAVALSTNFGRYFRPGTSTLDGSGAAGTPTTLHWVAPVPASGTYRSSVPVRATLRDPAGAPLAGQRVRFRLGPVVAEATTDTAGVATATLGLSARPGTYRLEAGFAGDAAYRNSEVSAEFRVTKAPSQLGFVPVPAGVIPSALVLTLRAADGTPLKERTVAVRFEGATAKSAIVEITDGAGQARVDPGSLAPGSYRLVATFGQPFTLPDGSVLALDDALYSGSTGTTTIVVGQRLQFSEEKAWLNYRDRTAAGATAANAGLSQAEMSGGLSLAPAASGATALLAPGKPSTVDLALTAVVAGRTIAAGTLRATVQANNGRQWRAAGALQGAKVTLQIDWEGAGGQGRFRLWITPAPGTGPLFGDTPATFELQLTLGSGVGERPATGATVVGGPDKPWTQEANGLRARTQ